jgi:hypothetical protein
MASGGAEKAAGAPTTAMGLTLFRPWMSLLARRCASPDRVARKRRFLRPILTDGPWQAFAVAAVIARAGALASVGEARCKRVRAVSNSHRFCLTDRARLVRRQRHRFKPHRCSLAGVRVAGCHCALEPGRVCDRAPVRRRVCDRARPRLRSSPHRCPLVGVGCGGCHCVGGRKDASRRAPVRRQLAACRIGVKRPASPHRRSVAGLAASGVIASAGATEAARGARCKRDGVG